MKPMDPENWRKKRIYTPEQMSLAKIVLQEVRDGRKLDRACGIIRCQTAVCLPSICWWLLTAS